MGVCCFQKKAISIQKKNIFIENREIDGKKKSIINDNDNENDNNNNNKSENKDLDNYSSGPILKLLIHKNEEIEVKNKK